MPSAFDQLKATPKKVKTIKSAYDSDSFDADGTIHVDGLVGSATISPSGRDVALASPEGLAIIDLDSPYSPPRRLSSHGLPWLVVDVQWSPFAARDYWVSSTANHRCLIWNLNLRDDSASGAIEHSLQGHSRAITDVNFSAHHPDSVATCSVDGYVHCWDLRRPRQPAITFCDWFAGATQVKYNRQDPFIIASSHDRWLHIWDERKSSEPVRSISAHTSKIYGIDWNRTRASAIVTCSLDKSIKFWDYEREGDIPERVIRTDFPVWRARHTPFAWGLLAMPQNEPGNLYLFDQREHDDTPNDGPVDPVATFEGHGDHKAKEFLWRSRGGISDEGIDNREFQLVSWGEDNKLRLTRPEPSTLEGVGYVQGMKAGTKLVLTRQGATYKTFRTVDDGSHHRRTATMSDPRTSNKRQSALTMGMKVPSYRTGPSWRGPSMKAKNAATRTVDRSQAQMNWMRGITMTKRKSSSDSPQRTGSKDSTMFGPFLQQDYWGEPETLQEEFVRISEQLPNVKWDSIDMDNLILSASLKGPWGIDEKDIFLKVEVDIPHAYPKTKSPRFSIEKNAFMPDGVHEKLERETHEIGGQYLKRKQNCLAAAFSYLLGETNLAESTNFFKNVRDLDDDIDALVDESSSEDSDNDIPAGGSASMSQDLSASTEIDTTLAPITRPTVPPVYRTCGARFSNDGRLVTFFPTKEARALLFSPNDTLKEKPKDQPTFAGFGRLTHDSPVPRKRYLDGEASATDDLSAFSDDSDDSSSSSDSELTSMHKISLWYRPGRRLHKTWSANESLRSSGGGTGAGTGTGTGTSRRRTGRAKNVVKCFDLHDMLPSKKHFAEEYAIFGDGAQVCEHNARVAERYGYSDLVHIWKYAALLLRSDIPLEVREKNQRNQSVLIIAKGALSRYNDDKHSDHEAERLSGRVKWGHHPIAQEFVHDLFDYFEQLADVQMLAMLSCIFGESSTEDPIPYAESHLTGPETPLPMKAPSFSLEYFPTDAIDWSLARPRSGYSSAAHTPYTSQTPLIMSDPQSPDILWMGDPGSQSYSTGETPPHQFLKDYPSEVDQTQSLSTSPNDRSVIRRSQSALASTLTSGLSRGLASASMVASSPPGRKRPSPAETILSHIPTNITWGTSTYFGGQAESSETARTSVSDDDSRRDELVSMIPVSVSVTIENETAFDEDGWLSTPLLQPSRGPDYASYRYAYAEMLQMWRLPLARLEIMKFNVLKDETSTSPMDGTPSDSLLRESAIQDSSSHSATGTTSPTVVLGGKRRSQLAALQASGRGLDVLGYCRHDEYRLQPLQYIHPATPSGGAVGLCERCRRTQTQLTCVFCHEPVAALYAACLGCGCASHEGCLAEWHTMGETDCPAGDDCECSEEADKGQVETWVAMRASLREREREEERARKMRNARDGRGRDNTRDQQQQQQQRQQHSTRGGGNGAGGNHHHHGTKSPPSTSGGTGLGSKAAGLATRLRRRSAPAPFSLTVEDTDEEAESSTPSPPAFQPGGGGGGSGDDAASVVSVRSSASIAGAAPTKPSPLGPGGSVVTASAARVSLGNRLRGLEAAKQQRPSSMRRKSGGNENGNGNGNGNGRGGWSGERAEDGEASGG